MKNIFCFRLLSFVCIAIINCCSFMAHGQNTMDTGRMERDIDIMEKVLNELFSGRSSDTRIFNLKPSADGSAQGSYVPGYGVIFIAPAYSGGFAYAKAGPTPRIWAVDGGNFDVISAKPVIAAKEMAVEDKEKLAQARTIKERNVKGEKPVPVKERNYQVNVDSILQARIELVTRNMKEFMVNYADAIGQLPADNRILLIYNENARNKARFFTINGEDALSSRTMPRMSAEVKREDLTSYRAGKINRKELESRIKMTQDREEKENFAEYKVFAGILESLYPVSQESLYRIRNISYHYLPSFGVIYFVDMNLRDELFSVVKFRGPATIPSGDKLKADSTQVKMKKEAYTQFQSDIRASLLDYGRTLRNLSPEQVILLTVSLPTCEECQVPERINVSIKKSVIDAYEQNKLDRKGALESIYIGSASMNK